MIDYPVIFAQRIILQRKIFPQMNDCARIFVSQELQSVLRNIYYLYIKPIWIENIELTIHMLLSENKNDK